MLTLLVVLILLFLFAGPVLGGRLGPGYGDGLSGFGFILFIILILLLLGNRL